MQQTTHRQAYDRYRAVRNWRALDVNAFVDVNRRTARPGLRSENSQNYYVPRVRTKFGERAFSYAGPVFWILEQ